MSDMGAPQTMMPPPTRDVVADALLTAIQKAAMVGASASDIREMDEAGKAALNFVQALAILEPSVTPAGVPLEHEQGMERIRQDGMLALERERSNAAKQREEIKARAGAQAPSPRKRIKARHSDGTESEYEMEG